MRTALSMSQSLNMMRGDFPPSSSETFFRLLMAQLEYTQNNNNSRKWPDTGRPPGARPVPLHDLLADGRGAGEAQFTDVWVFRQALPHHTACARGRSVRRPLLTYYTFRTRRVLKG